MSQIYNPTYFVFKNNYGATVAINLSKIHRFSISEGKVLLYFSGHPGSGIAVIDPDDVSRFLSEIGVDPL